MKRQHQQPIFRRLLTLIRIWTRIGTSKTSFFSSLKTRRFDFFQLKKKTILFPTGFSSSSMFSCSSLWNETKLFFWGKFFEIRRRSSSSSLIFVLIVEKDKKKRKNTRWKSFRFSSQSMNFVPTRSISTLSSSHRLYPNSGMIPKYTGYLPRKTFLIVFLFVKFFRFFSERKYRIGQTYGDTSRGLPVCSHSLSSFGDYVRSKSTIDLSNDADWHFQHWRKFLWHLWLNFEQNIWFFIDFVGF